MLPENLLTIDEVAQWLKLTPRTIESWIDREFLPAYEDLRYGYLVDRREIEDMFGVSFDEEMFTTSEVAQILRIPEERVRKRVAHGDIAACDISVNESVRRYRIARSDMKKLLHVAPGEDFPYLYNEDEVAEMLRIRVAYLQLLIRKQRFPALIIFPKGQEDRYRFTPAMLENFFQLAPGEDFPYLYNEYEVAEMLHVRAEHLQTLIGKGMFPALVRFPEEKKDRYRITLAMLENFFQLASGELGRALVTIHQAAQYLGATPEQVSEQLRDLLIANTWMREGELLRFVSLELRKTLLTRLERKRKSFANAVEDEVYQLVAVVLEEMLQIARKSTILSEEILLQCLDAFNESHPGPLWLVACREAEAAIVAVFAELPFVQRHRS